MPYRTMLAGLGLFVLVMAAPFAAIAENEDLERIKRTGIIRVAVPDNFPPFGDLGAGGKLEGYDIDIAVLIAESLGVKVDLIPVPSTARIQYLTDGKVDLVISSLGKDADREKVIDFSIAYAPFFSGVYGSGSVHVTKPEDLVGRTIAVTRGSIEDNVLTTLAPSSAKISRYDDNAGAEVAFLSNQAELIATANIVAMQILAKSPLKKAALKLLLRNSPCYIGVRKGQGDLLGQINETIAAARKDGRLNRMSEHWFKAPLSDPERPDGI